MQQLTNDHRNSSLLAEQLLAPSKLVKQHGEVGLRGEVTVQLGHDVVVVGIEELGHVQSRGVRGTTGHGEVLVEAGQTLRSEAAKARSASVAIMT